MDEYRIPAGASETEFTERRSRFLGRIWATPTEEEALACIRRMREQHWDATHNVYAYIIRGGATRYSDDGEPQGTAGMPVLEVLRREELYDVTCVVTRYFGGILLGAGGLVRAYAKSASLAVDAAGIAVRRVWTSLRIACPYRLYEPVQKLVLQQGGLVDDTQFGADVTLRVLLPQTQEAAFCEKLTDATSGAIQAERIGQEYRAFPMKKEEADGRK